MYYTLEPGPRERKSLLANIIHPASRVTRSRSNRKPKTSSLRVY